MYYFFIIVAKQLANRPIDYNNVVYSMPYVSAQLQYSMQYVSAQLQYHRIEKDTLTSSCYETPNANTIDSIEEPYSHGGA